jgi:hypothetical protein
LTREAIQVDLDPRDPLRDTKKPTSPPVHQKLLEASAKKVLLALDPALLAPATKSIIPATLHQTPKPSMNSLKMSISDRRMLATESDYRINTYLPIAINLDFKLFFGLLSVNLYFVNFFHVNK